MNTPKERSMQARVAAHRLHAAGKTNTAPARKAFMDRFEREVVTRQGPLPCAVVYL